MRYSAVKDLVRTGDVLAFRGTWLFSRLIRWYSRQPVSHVGLAVWLRIGEETEDRLCVLEAMEGYGVRLLPLAHALGDYWTHGGAAWWCPLRDLYDGEEGVGYALAQWGGEYASPYQFAVLMSPTLQRLRHLLGRPDHVGGPDRFHCSELVSRSLAFAGASIPKPACYMTPGDVICLPALRPGILIEPDPEQPSVGD